MRKVLIVDDNVDLLETCKEVLENTNYRVKTFSDPKDALEILRKENFDIALVDIYMPEIDGLELARNIKELSPSTVTIIMTAFPSLDSAIKAIRLSAYDYLIKPFTPDVLVEVVKRADLFLSLLEENAMLKAKLPARYGEDDQIIFASEAMRKVMEISERVAKTNVDVLITGESGVGKELIGKRIHKLSPRREKKFVAVNLSAIPDTLIESELFGYEKGAFTDARILKPGLIEIADGGTLFLDEITEISPAVQVKLLRFLQERTIRKLGGVKEVKLDVRVICASNKDVKKEVKEGRFREDLYWRINTIEIYIPPLRERREDIPVLINYFLKKYSDELGKKVDGIEDEVMEVLFKYRWSGNVRELQNVVKRAIVITQGRIIKVEDLPEYIIEDNTSLEKLPEPNGFHPQDEENFWTLKKIKVEEFEKNYLEKLLTKYSGNISKIVEVSGIPRATLYRLLKKYNLTRR